MQQYTYLSARQLSERIPYCARYINEVLRDREFIEGVHYIRPFNGRRVVYLWEPIEELMLGPSQVAQQGIPMVSGGICHG
ncbi:MULTISPECIES: hypothetical protein [unclassified Halorhodospira]|uniref:hypothetical protein n=1 Tax=unclassified Halorhodospira TaxID=2626748 RepID=UPI001EE7E7BE|nr:MULTISPECIES: hypothetical protein [unclassified Halorhodospira]MCG5541244.1 hypothetical protein [Halorhodospira sp. M39old]MCG5545686.1 hypothetical protein [Halorhodospira sp. M38]